MKTLIHNGVRPVNKLLSPHEAEQLGYNYPTHNHWFEPIGDGGYKIWSKRELLSGCRQEITKIVEQDGLIYCPICDEWFAKKQFVEKEMV